MTRDIDLEEDIMKKDNIVLIGMPASGKSTVGVILAKILGYNFIDSFRKKKGESYLKSYKPKVLKDLST